MQPLVLTRWIDAPPVAVFQAWSGPDILSQWWGPYGVTTTECEMDLSPGGRFRTLMRAADGSEYRNEGVFLEVAPPARLVFTDALTEGWRPACDEGSGRAFMVVTVSFDPDCDGTLCTASARHWSQDDRNLHKALGFHRIWGESLERMAACVQKQPISQPNISAKYPRRKPDMTPENPTPIADRELVLTRTMNAPRHLIWRCWTDPQLLREWFCPKPWTVTDVELDVRPGGSQSFIMRGPDGEVMPQRGVYLEVVENEKLVTTDAYVTAWEPSENPFMTAIITMEDAGDGQTLYTARALHWNVETRQQHEAMGFHEGWGICADQLEALAQTLK